MVVSPTLPYPKCAHSNWRVGSQTANAQTRKMEIATPFGICPDWWQGSPQHKEMRPVLESVVFALQDASTSSISRAGGFVLVFSPSNSRSEALADKLKNGRGSILIKEIDLCGRSPGLSSLLWLPCCHRCAYKTRNAPPTTLLKVKKCAISN